MEYEIISREEFEKAKTEFYRKFSDFEKKFFNNLELLIERINKLKSLKPGTLDYWTYYDAVLVQIRAMFIENPGRKSNHTFQNYLKKIGQDDAAGVIDDYLNTEIAEGISLKEAIKITVDKFIAHYDKINNGEEKIEQLCREKLTESNEKYSIGNILVDFLMILFKSSLKAWSDYYTRL